MKKHVITLAVCACIVSAFIVKCSSPAQDVEEAKKDVIEADKNLVDANQAYLEDIDNYKAEVADEIADNERRIAELKLKRTKVKKENRAAYDKKIAAIEEENAKLKAVMEDYLGEGPEKWEVFKAEFSHDMKELGAAFKDLGTNNVK